MAIWSTVIVWAIQREKEANGDSDLTLKFVHLIYSSFSTVQQQEMLVFVELYYRFCRPLQ